MKKLTAFAITKTGRRRNNQDNFMLGGNFAALDHDAFAFRSEGKSNKPFFAAVCDGMGGEASGERASYEACAELAKASGYMKNDFNVNKRLVSDGIKNANARLCGIMKSESAERMGSTVAAVLMQGNKLYYTNLGDSRIYMLRCGVLTQLTRDHTEGQGMVDAGVLSLEQLKTHPSRNKLNRHLGIFPSEMQLECAVYPDIVLKDGDKFLLCSDGVSGAVDNDTMTAILSEGTPVNERAIKLVDTAFANGSRDNMTAMVIDVDKAAPAYMPIVYGASALALAALLFFGGKALLNKDNGRGRTKPDATAKPTEETTEIPTEEPLDTELVTEPLSEGAEDEPTPTAAETSSEQPTPAVSESPSTETAAPSEQQSEQATEQTEDENIVRFSNEAFEQAFRSRCGYEGDVYVSDLLGIRDIDLSFCNLTDISDIAMFENLEALDLIGNKISDISALSGLTELKRLALQRNNISDISALSGLTNLEGLDLSANYIADVAPLAGLTKLNTLVLSENPVPQEQIDWLKQRLPNCTVIFYRQGS